MAFSSIHFFTSFCFVLILMIRSYSSWKSKIQYLKYKNIYIWVWLNEHPYSIHSGYLLFFETTIMGKTADLAMVQKTIIDTLHKDTLSQRRSLLKAVAVHRVLYQSILNARLTGRNTFGRKRCTSNRDDRKLENTVKQSRFKHLEELHKEWTEGVFGVRDVFWCWCFHCVFLSSPKSMQPSTRRFWSTFFFHLLTIFIDMLISFSSST